LEYWIIGGLDRGDWERRQWVRLNNRPRKTLGFATPNEMFFKDNNNKDTVALIV
jgi:hypothetical protein